MKTLLLAYVSIIAVLLSSTSFAQTPPVKEWTVLVYMNSDNNLWRFGQVNFAEMEKVGSSDQVNIIVEQDPEPRGMPTTRYYVTKNPNPQPGKVTSKVLQQLGETDMGDAKHLADFLSWGIQNFPAKHYALVMWNHGAGWRGASFDDNPASVLTVPEMSQAIKAVNRQLNARAPIIDLINFDECLMSTLEVAYELRDAAKVMVGSQFNEPGEGIDYSTYLAPLISKPSLTAIELSRVMVYQYVLRYAKREEDINYIALDLSKIAAFTQSFADVANNHLAAPASMQQSLKKAYTDNGFSSDLISGMHIGRKLASKNAKLSESMDYLLNQYGYPLESADQAELRPGLDGVARKKYRITRFHPGWVHYRYSTNQAWMKTKLEPLGDGTFEVKIPSASVGQSMQYVVVKQSVRGEGVAAEASSTIMREGKDPIVYHDKFPPQSPVIADAYTHQTKGAHGMTLYFFSTGFVQTAKARPSLSALIQEYLRLAFSKAGAPSWTKFFGL